MLLLRYLTLYFTMVCLFQPCASWSQWAQWTPCDVDCGTGIRQRGRICIGGTAGFGGCFGFENDTGLCNTQVCS